MDLLILLAAAILGFLFPAELIDALKSTDEKKARDARGKACICFGFLVILLFWAVFAY